MEVLHIDVEVQVDQQGYILVPSREARPRREPILGPLLSHPRQTMARSLWICPRRAGPAAEERQGDQGRQADRKTDRKGERVGRGNYGAGTSPCALAHVPCCHTKEGSIRVGLKDGGKRERYFFVYFFL